MGQAVLHFAGVNRAPDGEVEAANPAIASRLAEACKTAVTPHIVYANSRMLSDTLWALEAHCGRVAVASRRRIH